VHFRRVGVLARQSLSIFVLPFTMQVGLSRFRRINMQVSQDVGTQSDDDSESCERLERPAFVDPRSFARLSFCSNSEEDFPVFASGSPRDEDNDLISGERLTFVDPHSFGRNSLGGDSVDFSTSYIDSLIHNSVESSVTLGKQQS